MKTRLLLILFSVVVATYSKAQPGVFNKIYKIPNNINQLLNDLKSHSGYYYCAVGNGQMFDCAQQGVYKIDTLGNVVWYNQCEIIVDTIPYYDYIFCNGPYNFSVGRVMSIDFDSDSTLIVCGYAGFADDYGVTLNFIQKLDATTGNTIWAKLYPLDFQYEKVIVPASGLIYIGSVSTYQTLVYSPMGEVIRSFNSMLVCKSINFDVILLENNLFRDVNSSGEIVQFYNFNVNLPIINDLSNHYVARYQNKLTLFDSNFQVLAQSAFTIPAIKLLTFYDDGYYFLSENSSVVIHYSSDLTVFNQIPFNGILQANHRSIDGLSVTNNYIAIGGRENILAQHQSDFFLATSTKTSGSPELVYDIGVSHVNLQIDTTIITGVSYFPPYGYTIYYTSYYTMDITVKNYGNQTTDNYFIYYKPPGGMNCALNIIPVEIINSPLAPGNSTTITINEVLFSTKNSLTYDPNNVSVMFKICAWTSSPEMTTDADMTNNYSCGTAVGINDVHTPKVHLYPNPSSDNVFIQYPSNTFNMLYVFDTSGRLVVTETLPANTTQYMLTQLEPGYYQVKLTGQQHTINKPIIIVR